MATLWSCGVAMYFRSYAAAALMFMPLFLLLFLAPVFVPLDELTGWLHSVAVVNPFTRLLEAGRGFISGVSKDVLWAYGALVVMLVLGTVFALRGPGPPLARVIRIGSARPLSEAPVGGRPATAVPETPSSSC